MIGAIAIKPWRFMAVFFGFTIVVLGLEALVEWLTKVEIPDALVALAPILAVTEFEGQTVAQNMETEPSRGYYWKSSILLSVVATVSGLLSICAILVANFLFGQDVDWYNEFAFLRDLNLWVMFASLVFVVLIVRWRFGHVVRKTLDKQKISELLQQ